MTVVKERIAARPPRKISAPRSFLQVFLILWAAGQLFPIIWLFYTSFKPTQSILENIWSFPKSLYFGNYAYIWLPGGVQVSIVDFYKNSIIVAAASLLILAIVPTIAAYSISKIKFPGRNLITLFMIALFAIPAHSIVLPLFYFFDDLNLLNNYFGLIFPYVALNIPFSIILLQSFFREFPDELLEAARIDGCSEIRIFFNVVFPIARGAVSTVLIVALINVWNEFLIALVIMSKHTMKTLPPGIALYQGQYTTEWGNIFAAMASATIPMIILYFLFQRSIIRGMTVGAVKG
jgi:multiple sugar transport system permease protein/raffinose/stachyose/melibiose transport system permease protein